MSLSAVYAYIALGFIAGVWLATHPSVSRLLRTERRLCLVLGVVGLVASAALLVIPAWVRTLLAFATNGVRSMALFYGDVSSFSGLVGDMLRRLLNAQPLVGLCVGVLCGAVGAYLFSSRETDGARDGHTSLVLCSLATMMGLLHCLAWMVAYPHSPFPQPLGGAVSDDEAWVRMPPFLFAAPTFALACMLCFLVTSDGRGRRSMSVGNLYLPTGLCLGILLFRLFLGSCRVCMPPHGGCRGHPYSCS